MKVLDFREKPLLFFLGFREFFGNEPSNMERRNGRKGGGASHHLDYFLRVPAQILEQLENVILPTWPATLKSVSRGRKGEGQDAVNKVSELT
jgi:hypothetical protein